MNRRNYELQALKITFDSNGYALVQNQNYINIIADKNIFLDNKHILFNTLLNNNLNSLKILGKSDFCFDKTIRLLGVPNTELFVCLVVWFD